MALIEITGGRPKTVCVHYVVTERLAGGIR